MHKKHHYSLKLQWKGNLGSGTSSYTAFSRDHDILLRGKPNLSMSSDPAFRGNRKLYNPEELLVASLSSCHMLWYLHLCSQNKITVVEYEDLAEGVMTEKDDGSGKFGQVTLQPEVSILEKDRIQKAYDLHDNAHQMCFIAKSVNFPVLCKAKILTRD